MVFVVFGGAAKVAQHIVRLPASARQSSLVSPGSYWRRPAKSTRRVREDVIKKSLTSSLTIRQRSVTKSASIRLSDKISTRSLPLSDAVDATGVSSAADAIAGRPTSVAAASVTAIEQTNVWFMEVPRVISLS